MYLEFINNNVFNMFVNFIVYYIDYFQLINQHSFTRSFI